MMNRTEKYRKGNDRTWQERTEKHGTGQDRSGQERKRSQDLIIFVEGLDN